MSRKSPELAAACEVGLGQTVLYISADGSQSCPAIVTQLDPDTFAARLRLIGADSDGLGNVPEMRDVAHVDNATEGEASWEDL